jgi:hypothetical protein
MGNNVENRIKYESKSVEFMFFMHRWLIQSYVIMIFKLWFKKKIFTLHNISFDWFEYKI